MNIIDEYINYDKKGNFISVNMNARIKAFADKSGNYTKYIYR